ncbi:protein furry [Anaeramoeba flamelloides]|uniref:Protein furry n=1 Tax=Anaeramoeba flamelloides TaxID=1746091 RepID=A0ABQ8YW55_9EUKA|nr:protein furry [Anaeramoeba flamelloides]
MSSIENEILNQLIEEFLTHLELCLQKFHKYPTKEKFNKNPIHLRSNTLFGISSTNGQKLLVIFQALLTWRSYATSKIAKMDLQNKKNNRIKKESNFPKNKRWTINKNFIDNIEDTNTTPKQHWKKTQRNDYPIIELCNHYIDYLVVLSLCEFFQRETIFPKKLIKSILAFCGSRLADLQNEEILIKKSSNLVRIIFSIGNMYGTIITRLSLKYNEYLKHYLLDKLNKSNAIKKIFVLPYLYLNLSNNEQIGNSTKVIAQIWALYNKQWGPSPNTLAYAVCKLLLRISENEKTLIIPNKYHYKKSWIEILELLTETSLKTVERQQTNSNEIENKNKNKNKNSNKNIHLERQLIINKSLALFLHISSYCLLNDYKENKFNSIFKLLSRSFLQKGSSVHFIPSYLYHSLYCLLTSYIKHYNPFSQSLIQEKKKNIYQLVSIFLPISKKIQNYSINGIENYYFLKCMTNIANWDPIFLLNEILAPLLNQSEILDQPIKTFFGINCIIHLFETFPKKLFSWNYKKYNLHLLKGNKNEKNNKNDDDDDDENKNIDNGEQITIPKEIEFNVRNFNEDLDMLTFITPNLIKLLENTFKILNVELENQLFFKSKFSLLSFLPFKKLILIEINYEIIKLIPHIIWSHKHLLMSLTKLNFHFNYEFSKLSFQCLKKFLIIRPKLQYYVLKYFVKQLLNIPEHYSNLIIYHLKQFKKLIKIVIHYYQNKNNYKNANKLKIKNNFYNIFINPNFNNKIFKKEIKLLKNNLSNVDSLYIKNENINILTDITGMSDTTETTETKNDINKTLTLTETETETDMNLKRGYSTESEFDNDNSSIDMNIINDDDNYYYSKLFNNKFYKLNYQIKNGNENELENDTESNIKKKRKEKKRKINKLFKKEKLLKIEIQLLPFLLSINPEIRRITWKLYNKTKKLSTTLSKKFKKLIKNNIKLKKYFLNPKFQIKFNDNNLEEINFPFNLFEKKQYSWFEYTPYPKDCFNSEYYGWTIIDLIKSKLYLINDQALFMNHLKCLYGNKIKYLFFLEHNNELIYNKNQFNYLNNFKKNNNNNNNNNNNSSSCSSNTNSNNNRNNNKNKNNGDDDLKKFKLLLDSKENNDYNKLIILISKIIENFSSINLKIINKIFTLHYNKFFQIINEFGNNNNNNLTINNNDILNINNKDKNFDNNDINTDIYGNYDDVNNFELINEKTFENKKNIEITSFLNRLKSIGKLISISANKNIVNEKKINIFCDLIIKLLKNNKQSLSTLAINILSEMHLSIFEIFIAKLRKLFESVFKERINKRENLKESIQNDKFASNILITLRLFLQKIDPLTFSSTKNLSVNLHQIIIIMYKYLIQLNDDNYQVVGNNINYLINIIKLRYNFNLIYYKFINLLNSNFKPYKLELRKQLFRILKKYSGNNLEEFGKESMDQELSLDQIINYYINNNLKNQIKNKKEIFFQKKKFQILKKKSKAVEFTSMQTISQCFFGIIFDESLLKNDGQIFKWIFKLNHSKDIINNNLAFECLNNLLYENYEQLINGFLKNSMMISTNKNVSLNYTISLINLISQKMIEIPKILIINWLIFHLGSKFQLIRSGIYHIFQLYYDEIFENTNFQIANINSHFTDIVPKFTSYQYKFSKIISNNCNDINFKFFKQFKQIFENLSVNHDNDHQNVNNKNDNVNKENYRKNVNNKNDHNNRDTHLDVDKGDYGGKNIHKLKKKQEMMLNYLIPWLQDFKYNKEKYKELELILRFLIDVSNINYKFSKKILKKCWNSLIDNNQILFIILKFFMKNGIGKINENYILTIKYIFNLMIRKNNYKLILNFLLLNDLKLKYNLNVKNYNLNEIIDNKDYFLIFLTELIDKINLKNSIHQINVEKILHLIFLTLDHPNYLINNHSQQLLYYLLFFIKDFDQNISLDSQKKLMRLIKQLENNIKKKKNFFNFNGDNNENIINGVMKHVLFYFKGLFPKLKIKWLNEALLWMDPSILININTKNYHSKNINFYNNNSFIKSYSIYRILNCKMKNSNAIKIIYYLQYFIENNLNYKICFFEILKTLKFLLKKIKNIINYPELFWSCISLLYSNNNEIYLYSLSLLNQLFEKIILLNKKDQNKLYKSSPIIIKNNFKGIQILIRNYLFLNNNSYTSDQNKNHFNSIIFRKYYYHLLSKGFSISHNDLISSLEDHLIYDLILLMPYISQNLLKKDSNNLSNNYDFQILNRLYKFTKKKNDLNLIKIKKIFKKISKHSYKDSNHLFKSFSECFFKILNLEQKKKLFKFLFKVILKGNNYYQYEYLLLFKYLFLKNNFIFHNKEFIITQKTINNLLQIQNNENYNQILDILQCFMKKIRTNSKTFKPIIDLNKVLNNNSEQIGDEGVNDRKDMGNNNEFNLGLKNYPKIVDVNLDINKNKNLGMNNIYKCQSRDSISTISTLDFLESTDSESIEDFEKLSKKNKQINDNLSNLIDQNFPTITNSLTIEKNASPNSFLRFEDKMYDYSDLSDEPDINLIVNEVLSQIQNKNSKK